MFVINFIIATPYTVPWVSFQFLHILNADNVFIEFSRLMPLSFLFHRTLHKSHWSTHLMSKFNLFTTTRRYVWRRKVLPGKWNQSEHFRSLKILRCSSDKMIHRWLFFACGKFISAKGKKSRLSVNLLSGIPSDREDRWISDRSEQIRC